MTPDGVMILVGDIIREARVRLDAEHTDFDEGKIIPFPCTDAKIESTISLSDRDINELEKASGVWVFLLLAYSHLDEDVLNQEYEGLVLVREERRGTFRRVGKCWIEIEKSPLTMLFRMERFKGICKTSFPIEPDDYIERNGRYKYKICVL
jgi:hypothetical protein